MDRDGRAQGYEDRRATLQPGRILIPDLVAEPSCLAGVDMEAARGMLSPGHWWRLPRGSALPSFLAATDSLPAPLPVLTDENRPPLAVVH